MKRSFALFSLFLLLMLSAGRLPVYAEDEESAVDDGSGFFSAAPTISMDSAAPDLFTGTMRHSIPIVVPAGRKGMEPKLSLTYRSMPQNGWLGLGWELEVGDIERSMKYGVDYCARQEFMIPKSEKIG